MIELLIVVGVLGVLLAMIMSQIGFKQLGKARDAKRKDHLKRLSNAFEEYYNDNDHYPPADILSNCGSTVLAPYISQIPCDPGDESAYIYVSYPPGEIDEPSAYGIYASLEKTSDPVIESLGCTDGCKTDPPIDPKYNYGVSQGISVSSK